MKKLLAGAFALAAIIAIPGITAAATYAYVNTQGEVMTTEATSANSAIMTAPGIAARSGVMLIEVSSDEDFVGDDVNGV
ncbi:MAG: hypothetical protein V4644_02585 [Patescibacteria group bacterium]